MNQSTTSSDKTAVADKAQARSVSFKSVALPAEHGSWSLVSEPILLGMFIAPTWPGLALVVAAFFLFLLNRPFKIYWTDRRRGRFYERTALARRYTLIFGAVALAAAIAALVLGGWRPFVPFLLAAPLLLIFMIYDQRPGRHWQAELAAPVAFAALVMSVALAGGYSWIVALALWGFMSARTVPAVMFVRARLRLDKGKPVSLWKTIVAHIAAVVLVALLVWQGWLPMTAAIAMIILLGRAIWGFSDYRWRSSMKALGFLETGFGLLAVLLVAIGFWLW
jgi:hypothetical protein